ncbi:glycosyl hydrolase 53 [Massarina eburnea CBS 473.64]|uniref:Arabinogalactan endo-beta-1,4-galactanase n=1 Tax=Massarina eburnea CBS 473.64 TaxID=1395130 RepID=A0A6A6RNI5_9PLEO|nr:glycosyl hydrolase 53 [Massarina eburnea CBS 473.64]
MRFSGVLVALVASVPSTLAALTYKGVDWSSTLIEEGKGTTFKNSAGTTQPLETILKNSGVNIVRQRIWVNPSDGNYGLGYNIKLAKRAKAAGLNVYLDFHYSDTWADPSNQAKPSAWSSLSTSALTTKIYDYTKEVMDTFASNSIPLAIVSIGNEITPGLLFPTGQLSATDGPKNAAALLHSASQAIKDSDLTTTPKIMIHLDNGWKSDTQTWWYDEVLNSGGGFTTADFDIQGVSYYPFYSSDATLSALSSSLSTLVKTYSKDVMVVETDWPSYCPNPAYTFPSDAKSIPISADGQTKWVKSVAEQVTGVGSKGAGVFYWEPAWVSNAQLGSSCGYNLMVGDDGKAMDSLSVFASL